MPHPRMLRDCVVVFLLVAFAANSVRGDATWPQWRGPNRDGKVSGPAWPERLSGDHLRQVWRVQLGPSYSSPIVSGSSIFTTETRDKKTEIVQAFDRASGNRLWTAEWPGALSVPFFAKENGDWIRATPALDDETLFVPGMRDLLVALDAKTGKEKWRVDFPAQLNKALPAFGFVSSPLVAGDHLYVQAGAGFAKLEKASGKVVWRTLEDGGGMWGSAFSSPIRATIAGRSQLVVQTRTKLAGVDEASGEVLWSQEIPAFRGMNILTPTVIGDRLLTSSYGGKTVSLDVRAAGEKLAVSEAWNNKAQGYMTTPVVIDGHAYMHLKNQRFTCIQLATGKERWTTKPFGKYWSLVANGDRILALDERGELRLIRANPEKFELLGEYKISDESCWAHLAVCGDALFVRELNALAVYQWLGDAAEQPK